MSESKTSKRFQFTLKRLLLSILLFAVFCGLTRLASADGITVAALPATLFLALAVAVLTRCYKVSFVAICLLAIASHETTSIHWSGGFPFAEVRLTIVDDRGKALDNVRMTVTKRGNGKPAYRYPIAEYEGSSLISNTDGVITCHQSRLGTQFGGFSWYLFWCIPMGAQSPNYNVHLEHSVHGRMAFSIWQLFETQHESYEDFPTSTFVMDGTSFEMPVYEQRIIFTQ